MGDQVAPRVRRVRPEPLTASAWAPFGWLPVEDTDPEDGRHRLEFLWGDVHVNVIGHTLEELSRSPGALRCEAMFRHDTHTQVLMSLDHEAVIAVAPAAVGMDDGAALANVRAFVLPPLRSVVLHRGTWHWGPYPMAADGVRLFNVQGLRYEEDNTKADLKALGLAVDVEIGDSVEHQSAARGPEEVEVAGANP
jgi:ureidoglycolate hydrolase